MNAHTSADSFWNDARVVQIRELFDKGLSNNQIAHTMGVRSRSAIIGKLHRLGLKRETGPGTRTARASNHVTKRVKELKHSRPMESFVRTTRARISPAFSTDGITDIAVEIGINRVALMSARKDQCRWPAADDGSAVMVCGDPSGSGSYCQRHGLRSVRRPVASQRGLPAE